MKQFTLKDFIKYNAPCFNCGGKVEIIFVTSFKGTEEEYVNHEGFNQSSITPIIFPKYTSINLLTTYRDILTLHIHHKDNKLETIKFPDLNNFISKNNIRLQSECHNCYNIIVTNYLKFNLDKKYLEPLTISHEKFNMITNNYHFSIITDFLDNSTKIHIRQNNVYEPPIILNLPLLPLYKFKNKETLLNKINTLLLFL